MSKKRITMNEQVRRVVLESGLSRDAICKACGLDVGGFSRFMNGKRGLNLKTLDALADVLGLTLVAHGPVRVSPPARPGRKPKKGPEATMSKKRITMNEQVRRAIRQSGVSRYAILKACGLDVGGLSRFMNGKRGLNLKTVDALADVLGLTLVVRGPVRVSPPARPGRKPKAKKGGGS